MSASRPCPQCGAPIPAGAAEGLCPRCLLALNLATQTRLAGETQPPAGGPAVPPLPLEEVAKLFPQLEIIRLVGTGGMGAVYQARQPALDRFVALKLLHTPPANDPGFAERFAQEARALAKLNHPNIVALHEFGQAGGRPYFLMEFVDGVNLRQLQQAGRLSPREALSIVPQVCDALQYAHDEGIVHRDIKPENVLVDRKGRVKVADFGLAKLMGVETTATRLTGAGHVMGTPHYMAPEQVEHPLEVDHRADIFSLGVVFYELLTGELPLGKFPLPSKKVRIDVRLDEVVLRALEKEPALRYGQASELKTRVETIAAGAGEPGTRPPVPEAVRPRYSRLAIAGAGLALFGLAVGMIGPVVGHIRGGTGGQIFWGSVAGLICRLAAWGSLILGWKAIRQIRSAAGRLRGLALAMAGGLLLPWIVLDGAIANIAIVIALGRGYDGHTVVVIASLAHVLVLGVFFFGARCVWKKVSGDSALSPSAKADPDLGRGRRLLGYIAFYSGCLSGFIRSVVLASPWLAVRLSAESQKGISWFTLVLAVLAVGLGVVSRKISWGRKAVVIGIIVLIVWILSSAPMQLSLVSLVSPATTRDISEAIEPALVRAGIRYENLNVVTDGGAIRITVEHPRKSQNIDGKVISIPLQGELQVHRTENGWTVRGTGDLSEIAITRNGASTLSGAEADASTLAAGPSKSRDKTDAAPAGPGGAGNGPVFGPVVERVVNREATIDFDTALIVSAFPEAVTKEEDMPKALLNAYAWMVHEGLDAGCDTGGMFSTKGLKCVDMKTRALGGEEWDRITPERIGAVLADAQVEKWQSLPSDDKAPATYAFQTREGGTGLLQIIGFTDTGVKLRYKLVEKRAATRIDSAAGFEPVVERLVGDIATHEAAELIQLGTGKVFFQKQILGETEGLDATKVADIFRARDIDATGTLDPNTRGLAGWDCVAVPLSSSAWDNVTPAVLAEMLEGSRPGSPVVMTGTGQLPATYAVRTRTGRVGLLQILGASEKPRGVKIRYKLAQPVSREAVTVTPVESRTPDLAAGANRAPEKTNMVQAGTAADGLVTEAWAADVPADFKFTSGNLSPSVLIQTPEVKLYSMPGRKLGPEGAPLLIKVANSIEDMNEPTIIAPGSGALVRGNTKLEEGRVHYSVTATIKEAPKTNQAAAGKSRDVVAEDRVALGVVSVIELGQITPGMRRVILLRFKKMTSEEQIEEDGLNALQAWMLLMDTGRYAESWDAAAESFRHAGSRAEWVEKSEKIRRPLGEMISRTLGGTQQTKVFPGMPDGAYWLVELDSVFTGLKSAAETVVFAREKDGRWRVISYLIRPRTEEQKAAVAAARPWLMSIDEGHYSWSWTNAAKVFRDAITQERWAIALEGARRPLGERVFRVVEACQTTESLPGAPAGKYVVMRFSASFADCKSAEETVTFVQENDGMWRAAGYYIK